MDGISNSLAQGDFMLVIAGDGIRSDTEAMVQYLERTANMKFTLAVIETAVYQTAKKDLTFIQPRTLFKTKEIQRTVYVTDFADALPVNQEPGAATPTPLNAQYGEFWKRFLAELRLDDPEQPLANPVAKGNIMFPMPPGSGTAWITLYFFKGSSEIGCFLRINGSYNGASLYEGLKDDAEAIRSEIPLPIDWDEKNRRIITNKSIEGPWPPVNSLEVSAYFAEAVNAFVNAFKPRLERLLEN